MRFLSLQLLVFEAIKAGLLTYDFAPTSVEVCDGTGTRRLYVNGCLLHNPALWHLACFMQFCNSVLASLQFFNTLSMYVYVSQEATSDILWFIEAELARRVSISTQVLPRETEP